MKKILLDTNVIIDVFAKREPFFCDSYSVMRLCAEDKAEGYITASSLTDLYYLIHHETKDPAKSKAAIVSLLDFCTIIDVTSEDCMSAIASETHDFEDALIDACAAKEKISCIVTRNTRDFSVSQVKVLTPQQFLAE